MQSGYNIFMYSALEDALDLEPENAEALELMARLLTGRNKFGEARLALDRLASTGAFDETDLLKLEFPVALALEERGRGSFVRQTDFSRSLAIKSRLAELEPTRSLHRFEIAGIHYRLRDFERSEQEFRAALELRESDADPEAPDRAAIIRRAAQAALGARQYERATLWFARYCEEFPEDPLGPRMLKLAILERLLEHGGEIATDSLRRALGE